MVVLTTTAAAVTASTDVGHLLRLTYKLHWGERERNNNRLACCSLRMKDVCLFVCSQQQQQQQQHNRSFCLAWPSDSLKCHLMCTPKVLYKKPVLKLSYITHVFGNVNTYWYLYLNNRNIISIYSWKEGLWMRESEQKILVKCGICPKKCIRKKRFCGIIC